MAFDQEELQQLQNMFDQQEKSLETKLHASLQASLNASLQANLSSHKSSILSEVAVMLRPIHDELSDLRKDIRQLFQTEDEDIRAVAAQQSRLKRQVTQHEKRIIKLEASPA